jgi:dUTP pyrophosphatase
MNLPIQVYREHPDAKLPTKAHESDQCLDFYAAEYVELRPGETKVIQTGIRLILPEGYGLELRERSGLATKGIIVGAGVIDEGYTGLLGVVLRYLHPRGLAYSPGVTPFCIEKGQKIVQGELVKRNGVWIKDIGPQTFNELAEEKARGEKGFGSSG